MTSSYAHNFTINGIKNNGFYIIRCDFCFGHSHSQKELLKNVCRMPFPSLEVYMLSSIWVCYGTVEVE